MTVDVVGRADDLDQALRDGAHLIGLDHIRQDDRVTNDRDASLYKLGAIYSLSKATSLYSFVGYVKNNRLATLGLQNSTPSGVPGGNQFGVGLGIRHLF